jgi:hypothetical protein
MWFVPRRRSIASVARLTCSGRLLSPRRSPVVGSTSKPNLVAITTALRTDASASPTQGFVGPRTVDLGSIKQGDAEVVGAALEVSELGFGTLSFASTYGQAPENAENIRVIRGAPNFLMRMLQLLSNRMGRAPSAALAAVMLV